MRIENQTGCQPAGIPISDRVLVPTGRAFDVVRETLVIIDSVHGDGDLPALPVRQTRGRAEVGGYRFLRDGTPSRLEASSHTEHPHLTVAHEVGHFLDHQTIGARGRFASESRRLEELMGTLESTAAIQGPRSRLRVQRARVTMPDGSVRLHPVLRRYVAYLLQPKEIFARAYAQYIAGRSRHRALSQQVDGVRSALLSGQMYHTQWEDDDFGPVAEAFDALMRRKGWTR